MDLLNEGQSGSAADANRQDAGTAGVAWPDRGDVTDEERLAWIDKAYGSAVAAGVRQRLTANEGCDPERVWRALGDSLQDVARDAADDLHDMAQTPPCVR